MKTVIISPWSKRLRNGQKRNPKDYPYWTELVTALRNAGHVTIQVGTAGEDLVGADRTVFNLPFKKLEELLLKCDTWISVDNFFQHLAWYVGKKGIAIFGQSDPIIFGHNTNVNVLKSREFLRPLQFDIWERAEYRADVFASPETVMEHFNQI